MSARFPEPELSQGDGGRNEVTPENPEDPGKRRDS